MTAASVYVLASLVAACGVGMWVGAKAAANTVDRRNERLGRDLVQTCSMAKAGRKFCGSGMIVRQHATLDLPGVGKFKLTVEDVEP